MVVGARIRKLQAAWLALPRMLKIVMYNMQKLRMTFAHMMCNKARIQAVQRSGAACNCAS